MTDRQLSVTERTSDDIIRPHVDDDSRAWWAALRSHELLIQQCSNCGKLRHPPGVSCPSCHSFDAGYLRASGAGHIYSFSVCYEPRLPGFQYPHMVALIELVEGTRLLAGVYKGDYESVKIGAPVQIEFVDIDDQLTIPSFRLTRAS